MTSYQVAQWLRQGIAAAQAGDIDRAYELLLKVVDVDEYNEQAWLWLSSVVETDADREVCLENVLAINPDNKVARAGLVHLRSKTAGPPPPAEPEPELQPQPELEPASGVAAESGGAAQTDWWDQPETIELRAEPIDSSQVISTATAESAVPEVAETLAISMPKTRRRRPQVSIRRLAIALFLVLGLLAASVAVVAALGLGVFDPAKREYASAMRPLLAEYEAWWAGPQGALVNELNSLCGPAADGWRNQDVLLACSSQPAVDCARLTAHCETDVDAMRKRVAELSREARTSGEELLAAFGAVSPPEGIAEAHSHFLACIEARVADAQQINKLARGEHVTNADLSLICQMFSGAEAKVRAYVDSR